MLELVLVSFLSAWHKLESSLKIRTLIEKNLHQIACRKVYGGIFLISVWTVPIPGQVNVGDTKKQAEQAMEASQEGAFVVYISVPVAEFLL